MVCLFLGGCVDGAWLTAAGDTLYICYVDKTWPCRYYMSDEIPPHPRTKSQKYHRVQIGATIFYVTEEFNNLPEMVARLTMFYRPVPRGITV